MASLTGQQIQNSYQGLLKTENNASLPGGQTWITDGVGNRTGLFFWKDYATMGVSNNGTPVVSPFIDSQNTNFNVANSPMGSSGNNNLIFSDVNGNRTWGVIQNRFGGVQYDTAKSGQSHYFTNSGDGNAVIRVNSFNNVNNSDNWYLGYQKSPDSLAYNSTTGDLTLGRTDDTDLVVNIPSGGGGGSTPIYNLNQTRPIAANFLNGYVFKTTHLTSGYGTVGYGISSGTEFMVIPFTETTGRSITNFQFGVTTGVAGATVDVYLYKAYVKTQSINFGADTQQTLDGEYVAPIATGVDASTSGEKLITGLNINLPATEDSTYFFLYKMSNGVGVQMTQWTNTVQLNPNNSIQMSGSISYRMICWQSGGAPTVPTYLDLDTMAASTGSGLIRSLYTLA